MQTKTRLQPQPSGFALPAVLILSTGVLILLVTLMTIVTLERTTSKARVGAYQADLAVESGLEEAKMILGAVTSSDSFAVGVIPLASEFDDNGDGNITSEEDGNLDATIGERGRPYLYAIQGSVQGGDTQFRLTPLFATQDSPATERVRADGLLNLPRDPGLGVGGESNLDDRTAVRGPDHVQPPVTAWRTIRDENDRPIARYSYWVEDLQGYLDAEYVPGNNRNGAHARANEVWQTQSNLWNPDLAQIAARYQTNGGQVPLWPAPGINPSYVEEAPGFLNPNNRLLSEAAVYTLDQNEAGILDESQLDDTMRNLASKAPTPASLLALSGVEAPIERIPAGPDRGRVPLRGQGVEPRWVEENLVTGNRTWEEQAVVPFTPGIDPSAMGLPRLNLNRILAESGGAEDPLFGLLPGTLSRSEEAVREIATFVGNALPDFASERRGGFGNWNGGNGDTAYLETLAASVLDYADVDSAPTVNEGRYRGIDSHPFISEFATTTTWQWTVHEEDIGSDQDPLARKSFLRANGNLYILMTVEIFAELWNMSNQPLEGTVEFAYENYFEFPALGNPGITFMGDVLENQGGPGPARSFSTHNFQQQDDGFYYTPSRTVTLQPNEHLLVRAGVVRYGFYIGDESGSMPEPIPTIDGDDGNAQYRLRWNGVVCDRTAGGLERPVITKLRVNEPRTKANICGTWGPHGTFYTGMQDLRQSWWAGLNNSFPNGMVSENSYPQNYTPGRRNVRFGSLSEKFDEPYARVLPSEWPDGGHDSDFDVRSFTSATSGTRSLRPDDQRFVGPATALGRDGMWLNPESNLAPIFVSNLGRFVSETELGNVFDPIMWKGRQNPGQSVETWPYRELDFAEEPQVSNRAAEASHVGGGNTLRIGRPEHERFAQEPGTRASRLLDLFHCGIPLSVDEQRQQGAVRKIEGHVNINTASRDVLRVLAAGALATDPAIGQEASFDTRNAFAPRLSNRFGEISASDSRGGDTGFADEAGLIADAIIAGRPFVSKSQLADLLYPNDFPDARLRGRPVFGNKFNHGPGQRLQRTDRAAEEVFARVYNSATTRSRNFRIHVIGQALEQTPSGRLRVKATRKKSYRVFADPGVRNAQTGALDPANLRIRTLYETNL